MEQRRFYNSHLSSLFINRAADISRQHKAYSIKCISMVQSNIESGFVSIIDNQDNRNTNNYSERILYGIINVLQLLRTSWMKENIEVGIFVLKREKQTVFERCYQTSCFMSTDCRNIRTQLLVIDALFSNYLRASEPCVGRACQDNHSGAHHLCDDVPNRMPVLEMSVSESIRLNGTAQLCVGLNI